MQKKIKMSSIYNQYHKVRTVQFGKPYNGDIRELFKSLPKIQASKDLKDCINNIVAARNNNKSIVLSIGGCVIKCGLAPLINNLIDHNFITHVAMNSAAMIHDIEIAMVGSTSENIEDEKFGMSKETGEYIQKCVEESSYESLGYPAGANMGERFMFKEYSLLRYCYDKCVLSTVHTAIGTDTISILPSYRPDLIAQKSFNDFKILCNTISTIGNGGVFINMGSAVIMPEVFLKAVTVSKPKRFTVINIDMNEQYRTRSRLIEYPRKHLKCKTMDLRGSIEILFPILAAGIKSYG